MRRRNRNEAGAIAIMVAIMAMVLMGVAALTVDLGQAFVQKRAIQKKTDFAALAGATADDLPMTAAGITCSITSPGGYDGVAGKATDQAIIDTAHYLSTQPGGSNITPSQLTDCNLNNGEAGYGMFSRDAAGVHLVANPNQLSVISQPDRVDFGFAQVLGFNNVDVAGQATVEIKTPLMRTLPFYAKDGCNYGNQTVAQPSNGNSVSGILLSHPSETNAARLTGLTTSPSTTPANVPLNVQPPNDSLVINADPGSLLGTTDIGFFLSGTVSAGPEPVVVNNLPTSPVDANGNPSLFTPPLNGQITIPHLPVAVTSVEAVWYVRVKIGGQWSPLSTGNGNNVVLRAIPLTVGAPTLTCGQGSNAGNFGTLKLPPGNPPASGLNGNNATDQISYNIIYGLTHGLAPFKPSQLLPPDYQCTGSTPGAHMWPYDGTNCVDTVTGLDSVAAEQGFLTGINATYNHGLLGVPQSDEFCPNDYPHNTPHTITMRGNLINNDILTCYFTNDSTTVSQVSSASYTGPDVIDQSIYNSPRFVQVPILQFPGQGGSNFYQILGFRPGFITDQPPDATRLTGVPIASPNCDLSGNATGECNGIAYDHGRLNSVNVVFLNPKALPNPPLDPEGGYIPYVGTGAKIPLLVN